MEPTSPTAVSTRVPPRAVSITAIAIATGCIVLGVFGNARVLHQLYKRQDLRKVPHYLLANLSVTGLLAMSVSLPCLVVALVLNYFLDNRVPFATEFVYKTGLTVALPVCILNAATLSLMALDRQDCVLRPFKRRLTWYNIKKVLLGVWIITAVLSIPSVVMASQENSLFSNINPYNSFRSNSNTPSRLYTVGLGTLLNVVTFLVITITFVRVVNELRSSVDIMSRQANLNALLTRRENLITKTTYKICAVFLFAWLPLIMVNVVARLASGLNAEVAGTVRLFTMVMSNFNYAFNPLLHLRMLRKRPQIVPERATRRSNPAVPARGTSLTVHEVAVWSSG